MLHPGLYLISTESMLADGSFLDLLESALLAGLRTVQMRGKSLPKDTLLTIGPKIRRLTLDYDATFIVNDDPDLAIALSADGLHIGQDDLSPEEARRIMGPGKIIGYSTHNQVQILKAHLKPVDYIGVGPIFQTRSKENPDPVTGIKLLEWARDNATLPFVAIGGITLDNLDEVLNTGARHVAVISAICNTPDPSAAAQEFITRIENAIA